MNPPSGIKHYFGLQDDLSSIEPYLAYGSRMDFKSGDIVIPMNICVEHLYYLKRGRIGRLVVTANGAERMIKVITNHGLLGTIPFFTDNDDNGSVNYSEFRALEDCEVYRFSRESVYDVLLKDETVLRQLIVYFCNRIDSLNLQLIDTMIKNPSYRVSSFLYNYLCLFGTINEQGQYVYTGKLSHYDIAKYLGLNRVSVTHVLKDLQDKGLIYKDRQKLVLLDKDFFERL